MTIKKELDIIKILNNHNRIKILRLLSQTKKDFCVNEIADTVGISQSLASHQLAYLQARDVVESHRMGQTMCYTLKKGVITQKLLSIINIII